MSRLLLGFARLQRFAKDIAQRRARIGRTILLHRLLLLGDLHRLDREGRLLRPVEARHHRVELLADLEARSEEHTSELQSLMRISYAVFCLKKKKDIHTYHNEHQKTRQ